MACALRPNVFSFDIVTEPSPGKKRGRTMVDVDRWVLRAFDNKTLIGQPPTLNCVRTLKTGTVVPDTERTRRELRRAACQSRAGHGVLWRQPLLQAASWDENTGARTVGQLISANAHCHFRMCMLETASSCCKNGALHAHRSPRRLLQVQPPLSQCNASVRVPWGGLSRQKHCAFLMSVAVHGMIVTGTGISPF